MDNENQQKNSHYLDIFYTACENTGAFFGNLHAKFLNYTADYIAIGAQGFKKGHEQYKKHIEPAFNETKEKINEKLTTN